MSYTVEKLNDITDELCRMPKESEWVEFKLNNSNPTKLGENISALANSATLHEKEKAYILFGTSDDTHEIKGTTFKPRDDSSKVGNEELENWLSSQLDPRINFEIHEFTHKSSGQPLILFEIDSAIGFPVAFRNTVYIRVGSYTKPISKHRGKEKALWSKLERKVFEKGIAKDGLTETEVLSLLAYTEIFHKLEHPLPSSTTEIIEKMIQDDLVKRVHGKLAITNLGAILFANDLSKFDMLKRKAVRVILYDGNDKLKTKREQRGQKGYAAGVDGLVQYIQTITPQKEVLEGATLRRVPAYPQTAVRELVANALIHQDFTISGAGPMIEIFDNRIEISNPGAPLVDIKRIIDHSPRSRNEKLAGIMARMRICEERGSGVDKVVMECELLQLPAPYFGVEDDFTRATLFTHRSLRDMTKQDKIRATYYHAVIKYLTEGYMTNNSLRERFGIAKDNYPTASGIIRLALDARAIKTRDIATTSKYIPYWA